jgi:hypothetical protein
MKNCIPMLLWWAEYLGVEDRTSLRKSLNQSNEEVVELHKMAEYRVC